METSGDSSESSMYDERSLERTYNHVSPAIKGFIIGLIGDTDQVNDIFQAVFLAAIVKMRSNSDRKPFTAEQPEEERRRWLFVVAGNQAMEELRKRYARRKHLISLSSDSLLPLVADSTDPEARNQALEKLRAALAQLSPKYAQVIIFHYVLGYSLRELAEALGESYQAVKRRHTRAKKKLQKTPLRPSDM
jgi:RNA polymerase sigma-70 factor (ECF subfamily)